MGEATTAHPDGGAASGSDDTHNRGKAGGRAPSDAGAAMGDESVAAGSGSMDTTPAKPAEAGSKTPEPAAACSKQLKIGVAEALTVWLIVDGSGSMLESLGDVSRWVALRDALMNPTNGLVKQLERNVQWGIVLYDGKGDFLGTLPDGGMVMFSTPPATTCSRVLVVEPKRDNFAAIDRTYPPDPLGGSTPTDKAIVEVMAHLPKAQASVGKTIAVLATDGEPNDFCSTGFMPPDVKPLVVSATQQLAAAGVHTYVISLAGEDLMLTNHLIDVATAGGTGKPPFIPTDKTELASVLKDIAGTSGCDLPVDTKIKLARHCQGDVTLDGQKLGCNTADGWTLADATTIRLTGSACTKYTSNPAALTLEFPCDALEP
jgi:Mg-chelatase subunit ChlD